MCESHVCESNVLFYKVVTLEEEWGVYLCGRKQYESAIVHLIEAG